jgi:hypothetical protein
MRRILILVCIAVLVLFSIAAFAQSDTARLVGTITDASGAAIPNATITVTNKGTARAITVTTGASGEYVVNALPPGNYHVDVKQASFKTASADITLEVSQVREISLKMQAGSVETVVNVTDEVPLVETTTSSTGEVIQGRQVTELPLNGRNFTQLALLTPGVTRGAYGDVSMGGSQGTASEAFRNSETGGASISANGLRAQANNFILDGVDNNEGMVNSIVFFPPAEAIQEFRVNTSVAPAEFGRAGGAIVQTTIKGGTNAIHGSAFEFRRSGEFDAKPYGTTGPIEFKRNQFGGTLGMPIWKNKLFIFGDYQGLRQSQPLNVEFASVPTDLMRQGNFSELLSLAGDSSLTSIPSCAAGNSAYYHLGSHGQIVPNGYVFDPVTCQPFGWNGTTGTNIISSPNPVGLKYLQGYPEPNVTGTILNNFRAQRQSIRNFNDFDVRLDLVATQKDTLFARYSYGQDNFTVTNRLGPNNPSGFGSGDNFNHPRGVAAGYTHTFSDSVLNEFRFGYVRPSFGYNPPNKGETLAADIGIPNANRNAFLGGQALIGGNNGELEYQGDGGPYNVPQKAFQFSDSVTYTHGHHTLKSGFNIINRHVDFLQGNSAKGYFILGGNNYPGTGRFTGYEVSEVLAGFVDYTIGDITGFYETRNYETGYYAQDDWRVTNRLTLNLGLRYDLYTWPYEVNNKQSNYDPTTNTLVLPGAAGVPRSLINTDRNNVAPRFGFAYDLTGNGKTVVRGGYGMFFFLDRGGVGNQLSNNANFNGTSTYQACPNGNCTNGYRITLSGAAPLGDNNWLDATGALPSAVNTVNPNALTTSANVLYYPRNSQNSSVQQWNVQIERQIGANMSADVAYVGTKMDHLSTVFNRNAVPLGSITGAGAFTNVGSITETGFIGSGKYNGLQTRLVRRFANGLNFTAAYTYSKTTDNSNGAFSATGGGGRIFVDSTGNPLLRLNQGPADNDIRNFFVFSSLYELPFGSGKKFGSSMPKVADYVLGGWQWNNIVTIGSGTPIDLSIDGTPGNRPDVTGPVSVKIVNGNGVISGNFTKPAFITVGPPGNTHDYYTQAGNLGRNAVYGPGLHTWDMGLIKNFKVTERVNTNVRAEVFNLLNTPQYTNGSFDTDVSHANSSGVISHGAQTRFSSERQVQFALRVTF